MIGQPEHAKPQVRDDDWQGRPRNISMPPVFCITTRVSNWQQRDEDRAKDRAEHRAQTTDDDHREVVDRNVDLELLVIGDAEIVSVQHASHARVE